MNAIDNIGFGCVPLTLFSFESDAIRLLNTAFDAGIRHFDTAPLYGNGYSEKILGNFLRSKRNEITITTKFGLSPAGSQLLPAWLAMPLHAVKKKIAGKKNPVFSAGIPSLIGYRPIDKAYVQSSFERSIKSLGTTYIDHYLLHEALPSFLTDEALQYIFDLKRKGEVVKIGVAASAVNIMQLSPQQYQHWDVLQYE